MQDIYKPCPCGSGKKYKFCCNQKVFKGDPQELLRQAAMFPISDIGIIGNWEKSGLASIYLFRQMPNQRYMFAVYMVDYYCLGLKSTFSDANVKLDKILDLKRRLTSEFAFVDFSYEDARSLILGAIDYAAILGFEPDSDWQDSRFLIEYDRDYEAKFTFGIEGKPYYIQGPDDDVNAIHTQLRNHRNPSVIELDSHR